MGRPVFVALANIGSRASARLNPLAYFPQICGSFIYGE